MLNIIVIYILITLQGIAYSIPFETDVDLSDDKFQETEEDTRIFHGYLFRRFKKLIPNIIQRWKSFKEKIEAAFNETEERQAFFNYAKNVLTILLHNAKNSEFELGENDKTHLSREEYFKLQGIQFADLPVDDTKSEEENNITKRAVVPVNIDWRTKRVLNPIQDQGPTCGSCYAFSSLATVEAAVAIKTGKLYKYSESEIVDCSSIFGNSGCHGGVVSVTYRFMMSYPLVNLSSYPYVQKEQRCKVTSNSKQALLSSFVSLRRFDENGLIDAIKKNPVLVSIDASQDSFRFYKSGIYSDLKCSGVLVNHGVTLVGAQNNVKDPIYIIRNSWGITWGEKGYVRFPMYKNLCGVSSSGAYPVLK